MLGEIRAFINIKWSTIILFDILQKVFSTYNSKIIKIPSFIDFVSFILISINIKYIRIYFFWRVYSFL